ncbi:hypothetical protein [Haliscomenobacter hydrossis]|uniref:hypothetical protein n=1 Tax=Haliscomenobacter hydrossis TaxID=2350 RepID=UPI0011D29931|nr:hypothetical protein [Haliscomenobacter hydrossis]
MTQSLFLEKTTLFCSLIIAGDQNECQDACFAGHLNVCLVKLVYGDALGNGAFWAGESWLWIGLLIKFVNMSHPECLKRPKRIKKVAQRTQRKAQSAQKQALPCVLCAFLCVLCAKKVSLLLY